MQMVPPVITTRTRASGILPSGVWGTELAIMAGCHGVLNVVLKDEFARFHIVQVQSQVADGFVLCFTRRIAQNDHGLTLEQCRSYCDEEPK